MPTPAEIDAAVKALLDDSGVSTRDMPYTYDPRDVRLLAVSILEAAEKARFTATARPPAA